MANIIITNKCNLRCPYCFADEFVGRSTEEISMENLDKALDFALTNKQEVIGIIGGEPTVHKQFNRILDRIIYDERIQKCTIYTNGILINNFFNQIIHPKFEILFNCNSPTDIGEINYQKMVSNIRFLCKHYYMSNRITLGINMYKPNFDFEYIINLLKEFNLQYVRTAVSIPQISHKESSSIEYFRLMKPQVLNFFYRLLDEKIMPFYDCNAIPRCIFTDTEYANLFEKLKKLDNDDINITSDMSNCSPVIDILPDLSIIRCFALSQYKKGNIMDFNNIHEARAYFNYYFDTLVYHINTDNHCKECTEKIKMKCAGGCYSFKAHKVMELLEKL